MSDRAVEPGVWGACSDGRCIWKDGRWNVYYESWDDGAGSFELEGAFSEGYCPARDCGNFCGEGGHVRPNLRRVAEEMLEEALTELRTWQARGEEGAEVDKALAWDCNGRVVALRKLLASNCPRCGGTGYVTQEGAPDFAGDAHAVTHAMVPCPKCQPDAKGSDDAD